MTENPYLDTDSTSKDRYVAMARSARERGTDTAALWARRVGLDPQRAGDGTQPVRYAQQLLHQGREATNDILAIRDRAARDGNLTDAALENAIEVNYASPWDNSPARQEAQAWITDALENASRTANEPGIRTPDEYDPGHPDQAGIDSIRDNAVAHIERWETANKHAAAVGERQVEFNDTERIEQHAQQDHETQPEAAREEGGSETQWELDPTDQPYTPERVTADWIQSNVMVEAYLDADRPDLIQEWIETLDENLRDFESGGTPPGSDELYGVYHDAIAREAIPYGQSPISAEETRRQLSNIGFEVPPLDLEDIQQRTGIRPHDPAQLASRLDGTAPRETEASTATQATKTPELAATETEQKEHDTAPEVTIYTTPSCPGCEATKRALNKAGISYDTIDLSERPDLVEAFKQQGFGQSPIVETQDGDRWSGFNPAKLQEHGLDYRSRQRGGEHGTDTSRGR